MKTLVLHHVTDVRDAGYEAIQFHGVLDAHTAPQAEHKLSLMLRDAQAPYLMLDLSDFSYVNSNGIGLFLEMHMKCLNAGKKLVIAGLKAQIADIFELVGLPKIIQTFQTTQKAIHYMTTS